MSIQSGQTYKLINAKSGTALDLSGTDNFSVLGWSPHDGANQKWVLQDTGGHWTLRNVHTGRYLGMNGAPADGTPIVASDGPVNWDIWPDEEDSSYHRLFVPGWHIGMNVDLSDHGNANNGTIVTLWTKWNGANQKWKFVPV